MTMTIETGKNSMRLAADAINIAAEKMGNEFQSSVNSLSSGKKIFVSGIGKSGLIARKISATFASIGLESFFLHPVEALHGDIGMVSNGDIALLLSKSGATDELVRLIPFLKSRNVTVISIVGNMNSFLAANSDYALDGSVREESCPFNIAPTTSTTLALAIGDALAVAVMQYKKLNIADFSRNHPLGQIGRNLTLQVKDIMHKGDSLPLIPSGSSFKSALVEITQKKLGCVCIVGKGNILSGIITDGDIRRILQDMDNFSGLSAERIMTANPVTVGPDLYLGDALAIMENRDSQISVLPVVDSKMELIGVIRIHDIVRSSI